MNVTERYYTALQNKDAEEILACLHKDVKFVSPLATVCGKDAVGEAAFNFAKVIKGLTIQAKFDNGE